MLGGVATFPGALIGGLAIVLIPELSSQWATANTSLLGLQVTGDRPYAGVLLGTFLIVVTFVLPGGIMAGITKLKKKIITVVPSPPANAKQAAARRATTASIEADTEPLTGADTLAR